MRRLLTNRMVLCVLPHDANCQLLLAVVMDIMPIRLPWTSSRMVRSAIRLSPTCCAVTPQRSACEVRIASRSKPTTVPLSPSNSSIVPFPNSSKPAATYWQELEAHAKTRKFALSPRALRAKHIDVTDEGAIYKGLCLQFVEPELREGRGEVEAARTSTLPKLVTLQDLFGDLHMHSVASDGANTIEEMAAAAKARGYSYIAITDHSQSLKIARGVSPRDLRQQLRAIDRLNAKLRGMVVLKSAEVDILEDGSLDYPNGLLKELDLTICSIPHSAGDGQSVFQHSGTCERAPAAAPRRLSAGLRSHHPSCQRVRLHVSRLIPTRIGWTSQTSRPRSSKRPA